MRSRGGATWPSVSNGVLERFVSRTTGLRAEVLASERDPRQVAINGGVDYGVGFRKWLIYGIPQKLSGTSFRVWVTWKSFGGWVATVCRTRMRLTGRAD
jgi:hypothetical protein